jgi:hypothetical protein
MNSAALPPNKRRTMICAARDGIVSLGHRGNRTPGLLADGDALSCGRVVSASSRPEKRNNHRCTRGASE